MKRVLIVVMSAAVALGVATASGYADWTVEVEGGRASTGYNDVRIPGNTGTDVSLADELIPDAVGFVRWRLTTDLGARQQLSVLVAPLRIHGAGSVNHVVDFNGVQFAANTPLTSYYRFDSYRLTYRYKVHESDRFRAAIGLTAKIRDAAIRISSSAIAAEKKNTGFVPLINFLLEWQFQPKLGLSFSGDALAAPQGRAEDVLLALYADPVDRLRIKVGYRLLEGGADNDEVYTFALVHYLAAAVAVRF